MSQPDLDQTELAKRLYAHYREAIIVDYARVAIEGAWQPWVKECHANATTWTANNSRWSAVRGWLVFDFSYSSSPFIRFLAHSVVQDPEGKLWDITPPAPQVSRRYPFFRHPGPADEFQDFVERHGSGRSFHRSMRPNVWQRQSTQPFERGLQTTMPSEHCERT